MEIQASEPIVPFRETAVKAPDMAPPKTPNAPRGTIHGSSAHSLAKFTIRAVPLPEEILSFLRDNLLVLKRLQQERKMREQSSESSEAEQQKSSSEHQQSNDDLEEGVSMYGDVYRKPTVRIEEFWSKLDSLCKKAGPEWQDISERVWAFGPQSAGGCVLVDAREGGPFSS